MDLQLRSAAGVVLAVGGRGSWMDPKGQAEALLQRALLLLWGRHQSFRGLLLAELDAAGVWGGLLLDPFAYRDAARGVQVTSLPGTGAAAKEAAVLAKRRARDLGNSPVNALIPATAVYVCRHRRFDNAIFTSCGYHQMMINELGERLNLIWAQRGKVYWEMQRKRALQHNQSGEYARWYSQRFYLALVTGEVDFAPVHIAASGNLPLDTLGASHVIEKTVILVPHARALPSWSLPLRVFGPDIWSALLGAAAVYALAWSVVAGETLAASVAAVLRAFSSCGGSPQDRVRATPQRLQLASALLASAIVIVVTYQGRLFTLTTTPERYPEIDDLPQLAASGLTLLAVQNVHLKEVQHPTPEMYTAEELAARREAARRLRVRTGSHASIIAEVALRQPVAWLLDEGSWRHEFASAVRLAERFRPMRQPITVWHAHLHPRRNWPWTDAVNRIILLFHAFGLQRKWVEDYNRTSAIWFRIFGDEWTQDLRTNESVAAGPRSWILGDVTPHLQLLSVGLTLAVAVFGWELLRGRTYTRKACFYSMRCMEWGKRCKGKEPPGKDGEKSKLKSYSTTLQ